MESFSLAEESHCGSVDRLAAVFLEIFSLLVEIVDFLLKGFILFSAEFDLFFYEQVLIDDLL